MYEVVNIEGGGVMIWGRRKEEGNEKGGMR
jgi:hypothetical protein